MKTKLFVLIGLFFFSTITYSQQQVINATQKEKALQTPRELLWLTLNKTTFFPSEYLYFNGYLLDAENLEASTVSQSIYLRLISADRSYSKIKRSVNLMFQNLVQNQTFLKPCNLLKSQTVSTYGDQKP